MHPLWRTRSYWSTIGQYRDENHRESLPSGHHRRCQTEAGHETERPLVSLSVSWFYRSQDVSHVELLLVTKTLQLACIILVLLSRSRLLFDSYVLLLVARQLSPIPWHLAGAITWCLQLLESASQLNGRENLRDSEICPQTWHGLSSIRSTLTSRPMRQVATFHLNSMRSLLPLQQ